MGSGISKVNANTELRTRHLKVLRDEVPAVLPGASLLRLQQAVLQALKDEVHCKLDLWTSLGTGS